MFQKLKQKKGETLIEVLISLMMALICMGILTMSVTMAAHLNRKTRSFDKEYSEQLQKAEDHTALVVGASSYVTIVFDGGETKNIDIILYGAEEDASFVAYE